MTELPHHLRELVDEVRRAVGAGGLLPPGEPVVVGVSGGADSVALLALLVRVVEGLAEPCPLHAAHLHHGLREDAEDDLRLVEDVTRRLGVPLRVGRADVPEQAREGEGIEEAARRVRYDFLRRVARDVGAPVVAVGHHRGDQVETVLHRILRGTHLRGLAGMASRRDLGAGVRLVRPMLEIDPARLRAFLRDAGLAWREDPTNADLRFTRNALRHRVLPEARRINPRVDEALVRLARSAGEVEAYLRDEARGVLDEARDADHLGLRYRRHALTKAPTALRAYLARGLLEASGAGMKHVSTGTLDELVALFDAPRGAVSVPGGDRWFVEGDWLVHEAPDAAWRSGRAEWHIALPCPGEAELPDGRVVACRRRAMDADAFAAHVRDAGRHVAWLDADRLAGGLSCRCAGVGESLVPLGASRPRSIGELLRSAGVPASRRAAAACVCDEEGIVWVAGVRLARRVAVEASTREVVELELLAARTQR